MKSKLGRKGMTAGDMAKVGMTFILVMIMAIIGIWVSSEFSQTAFSTTPVVNDSTVVDNGSYVALGNHYVASISSITNASMAEALTAGNYSCTTMDPVQDRCNITLMSNDYGYVDGMTVNISYDIYDSTEFLAARNATSGIGQLTNWAPVIAVTLAAALVIGILLTSTRRSGGI